MIGMGADYSAGMIQAAATGPFQKSRGLLQKGPVRYQNGRCNSIVPLTPSGSSAFHADSGSGEYAIESCLGTANQLLWRIFRHVWR